jgi:prolyl oligopeptidase
VPSSTLRRAVLFFPTLACLTACSSRPAGPQAPAAAERPPRATQLSLVEDYHGTPVADPYRWLERTDGEETRRWIAAQNAATEAFLARLPLRETFRQELERLGDYRRWSPPEREGSVWHWTRNDGLQNQPVLYAGDAPDAPGRVLLDPNQLSAQGTVALSGASFRRDGAQLAYALSRSGSDWREWRVRDVATGKDLDDVVPWCKFSSAPWTHDGAGFFYQRYPEPAAGQEHLASTERPQLRYHRVGTPSADDRVVYERPDQPNWGFQPHVTEDGRYLVLEITQGTDERNRVAWLDLQDQAAGVQPLFMELDATWEFLGNDGTTFYFRTDRGAPRYRVVARTLADPALRDVVPQRADVLAGARMVADRFVLTWLRDASHAVEIVGKDGKSERTLELPGLGTVGGFTGRRGDTKTFFSFASFTVPDTVLMHDFATGKTITFRAPELAVAQERITTRRVFFQSRDGTRVPMFLVHPAGLELDGSHPTWLYGYGGFNIPLLPSFSTMTLAWVLRGGVFAQACLRGGGEYGAAWHEAGMLARKQNVFDDFAAAAQYLVRNAYCTPRRLGINGRSNGGLLVGAMLAQRPELFGAAIPEVGVLDMLRYHRFTIGWAWASEYGRSDDPKMFPVLRAYSPLHNLQPGKRYPPTLIMTGDHDDRVVPGHSFKFAAALQAAQGGDEPILIRVDTDAGHGAGKPTRKRIDEAADRLAFLDWALRR